MSTYVEGNNNHAEHHFFAESAPLQLSNKQAKMHIALADCDAWLSRKEVQDLLQVCMMFLFASRDDPKVMTCAYCGKAITEADAWRMGTDGEPHCTQEESGASPMQNLEDIEKP